MKNLKLKKESFLKKHRYEIMLLLVVAVFVAVAILLRDRAQILSDREAFQQLIRDLGPWGPLVTILIIIFEVILAPLPGFVPAISAGFVFGTVMGSIYTFIGNVIGSLIVFWLARIFGRYIAEKLFNSKRLKKYGQIIKKHENWLFATYFIPIFPSDIISAAFGLSAVSPKKFALVMSIGFIFHVLILNYLGDFLANLYF